LVVGNVAVTVSSTLYCTLQKLECRYYRSHPADIIIREHRLMYDFHQEPLSVNLTKVRYIGIFRNSMECKKGVKPELILIKK
jgi:hypothetical protein